MKHFDDFRWINNRCTSLKQRDAELEKSENLKCEGGVKTSPTQVSKVYLMGRSKLQSKIWKPHIFIFCFGYCIIKYKNNLSPDQLKFINYILSKHNFQSWIFLKNEFEGHFQTKKTRFDPLGCFDPKKRRLGKKSFGQFVVLERKLNWAINGWCQGNR